MVSVGGKEIKWHQPAHHKLRSQQGPHFSPNSTAKTNVKAHSSGRMVSGCIGDVVITSVHSEKPVCDDDDYYYYYYKSQETTVFSSHQKLTSTKKLRPEK